MAPLTGHSASKQNDPRTACHGSTSGAYSDQSLGEWLDMPRCPLCGYSRPETADIEVPTTSRDPHTLADSVDPSPPQSSLVGHLRSVRHSGSLRLCSLPRPCNTRAATSKRRLRYSTSTARRCTRKSNATRLPDPKPGVPAQPQIPVFRHAAGGAHTASANEIGWSIGKHV